jgi:CheY-like chemotaxis protein
MQYADQIETAYEHLYDLVYLRTHPLAGLLAPDPALSRKDRAWRLHHLLLEAIEELDPGPQAPTFSREWRRHRLMVLRYVDGLDPQSVADQIGIGRRHYYREQEAAIEAIACILRDRYLEQAAQAPSEAEAGQQAASPSRLELLRLEVARSAQAGRYASLSEVFTALLPLLRERLAQRQLDVHLALPESLPRPALERSLLRQLLLGLLGFLIERAQAATIQIVAQLEAEAVYLALAVEPPSAVHPTPQTEVQERLSAFEELAALGGARVVPLLGRSVAGFELRLPTGPQQTVLVVDDNEDVIELFQRYLGPHGYQVAAARTAQEALDLAPRLQPQAITLDLMMPGQDGWDLLHLLLDRPDTRHIPIIVCSVLRQKELALSLGATAFLGKPITEEALLAVLEALG